MCARQSRRVTRRVRAFGHPHRWCASSRSRARRSGSRRTPRPDRRSVQTVTHAARAQPRDEHVHARDSAMVQAVTSLSHTLLVPCPPSRRPLAPSASARRCPRSPAPSHSSQMCCRPPATRHRTPRRRRPHGACVAPARLQPPALFRRRSARGGRGTPFALALMCSPARRVCLRAGSPFRGPRSSFVPSPSQMTSRRTWPRTRHCRCQSTT